MWSLRAHAAPAHEQRPTEREKAHKPTERGRKLLNRLKDAPSRLGEGFCWKRWRISSRSSTVVHAVFFIRTHHF
jgi:hypothetical protein